MLFIALFYILIIIAIICIYDISFFLCIIIIICIIQIIHFLLIAGWLESGGSRIVYELDYQKPVLHVIPIQSILGKLPVVPIGDTRTILYHLHNVFPGAPGDHRPGSGDGPGCRMWFVN